MAITLSKLRESVGLSQAQLASACGLDICHLQKIESGELDIGSLHAVTFLKMADALCVDPHILLHVMPSAVHTLRFERGEDFIELQITDFEFPDSDSSWLMMSGTICVAGNRCEGFDPCLELADVVALQAKAQSLLDGTQQELSFHPIEQNLFFEVQKERSDARTLKVFFFPESSLYLESKSREKVQEVLGKIVPFEKTYESDDAAKIVSFCEEARKRLSEEVSLATDASCYHLGGRQFS